MVIQTKPLTVEAFDELVKQPEYEDRNWEYIGQEMVEVGSNGVASEIAGNLVFHIKLHMREVKDKGRVTVADAGYQIGNQRYIPDVAYISRERQPQASSEGYNPNVPDLAIEVISDPSNSREMDHLRVKTVNYLLAGVLLWVIHPTNFTVEVYRAGQTPQIIGLNGVVEGDAVLPGLKIAVRDVFEGIADDKAGKDETN